MSSVEKVALFTNEYPPHVYGGAGVHVEYLSRELARLVPVEVRCFGDQDEDGPEPARPGLRPVGRRPARTPTRASGARSTRSQRSLAMAKDTLDADVVHCHTWYTQMGGFLARQLWDVPLVITTHSLEPLRPWKVRAARQRLWPVGLDRADGDRERRRRHRRLAGDAPRRPPPLRRARGAGPGHPQRDRPRRSTGPTRASTRSSATASTPTGPTSSSSAGSPARRGSSTSSTRSRASTRRCRSSSAPAPPTRPRSARRWPSASPRSAPAGPTSSGSARCCRGPTRSSSTRHAAVFCCPSVYEPFGIINLEAMACETAVVASAVGGIPEVVVPGETGLLVDLEIRPGTFDPVDPARFSADLAAAINTVGPRRGPARALRAGGPAPRRGPLQLGGNRRADDGALPLGRSRLTVRRRSTNSRHDA